MDDLLGPLSEVHKYFESWEKSENDMLLLGTVKNHLISYVRGQNVFVIAKKDGIGIERISPDDLHAVILQDMLGHHDELSRLNHVAQLSSHIAKTRMKDAPSLPGSG